MKVALYVRVSTQEQAKEGYSVGEQTERLANYCKAHDWKIYDTYTDAGFTGSNTKRPALQQMIRDVKDHKFQKVIVYKLDRLSRSQKDTLSLIEDIFLNNDVDFVSMSENFDTSTPFGKAMIGILAVFAQLEREQIKERMQMGMEARIKKGYWHGGGEAPYGYDYVNGNLVINEFESMIVRIIFDMAYEGISDNKISQYLNENGYKTRKGDWTRYFVRKILKKDVYAGKVQYDGCSYDGLHEPIIESEQFSEVQKIKKKRYDDLSDQLRNAWKASSCIGGLIYCAKCGNKYYARTNKCHKPGKLYTYQKFICEAREYGNKKYPFKCTNKNWRKEKLVGAVLDEIRKLSLEPDYINSKKNKSSKKNNSKIISLEIKKIDNQISKLVDLYSIKSVSFDMIKEKIDTLEEKRKALEDNLAKIEDDKQQSKEFKKIKETIKQIPNILDNGSEEDIRNLVVALIRRIEIDGDDIAIYWNF